MAGKIGFTSAIDNKKTTELSDEFETVCAGDGVPPYVIVALLESLGRPTPTEHGDEFRAVCLGISAVNPLPQDVPNRSPGLEVMPLVEDLAEMIDLGIRSGGAKHKVIDNEG